VIIIIINAINDDDDDSATRNRKRNLQPNNTALSTEMHGYTARKSN
jgi:hypothetical protein